MRSWAAQSGRVRGLAFPPLSLRPTPSRLFYAGMSRSASPGAELPEHPCGQLLSDFLRCRTQRRGRDGVFGLGARQRLPPKAGPEAGLVPATQVAYPAFYDLVGRAQAGGEGEGAGGWQHGRGQAQHACDAFGEVAGLDNVAEHVTLQLGPDAHGPVASHRQASAWLLPVSASYGDALWIMGRLERLLGAEQPVKPAELGEPISQCVQ